MKLSFTHLKNWLRMRALNALMRNAAHPVTLDDGTVVVRMSAPFHAWTYGKGYGVWQATAAKD